MSKPRNLTPSQRCEKATEELEGIILRYRVDMKMEYLETDDGDIPIMAFVPSEQIDEEVPRLH